MSCLALARALHHSSQLQGEPISGGISTRISHKPWKVWKGRDVQGQDGQEKQGSEETSGGVGRWSCSSWVPLDKQGDPRVVLRSFLRKRNLLEYRSKKKIKTEMESQKPKEWRYHKNDNRHGIQTFINNYSEIANNSMHFISRYIHSSFHLMYSFVDILHLQISSELLQPNPKYNCFYISFNVS